MAETSVKALLLLTFLAGSGAGCEDKPKESRPVEAEDGGEAQLKGVDPKLAEAVARAKKADHDAAAGEQQEGGPPESGVFEPGKADEQLKKGAPPKITLGSAGSEPRIALTRALQPGWKDNGSIDISLRMGRNAVPELGFALTVEALKPKADAPSGSAQTMVAKVDKVAFNTDVGAQGKELAGQLAKMRGSRIEFRVVEGGVGVDYAYSLAKGADPNLEMVLRGVGEALETATIGVPKESVGAGGFWLITTRGLLNGAEVVSYRMMKLDKVEGDTLSLSVNTKRYAVTNKLEVPGIPPGTELVQFQSTVEGTLSTDKSRPIAVGGSIKQAFMAALAQPSNPQQPLGMQSSSEITFKFGKK
jgi:hypothetical protein